MRRLLLSSLVLAAAAACGPGSSDVEVDWTFEGVSCADAQVATIQVDIAGEVLQPNQFSCADASLGADLGTYVAGTYQITITGLDALGTVTHQIMQSVVVHSGRRETFAIDVPRVAPTSTASANITWTFNGQGCAAANVDHVTILVDPDSTGAGGINAGTVACSTMGTEGAFVEPLTPGAHSFAILGLRTLSDGAHLVYRTHHPPTSFFQAGLITDVAVSAESPP
jgi:hypothetical protein